MREITIEANPDSAGSVLVWWRETIRGKPYGSHMKLLLPFTKSQLLSVTSILERDANDKKTLILAMPVEAPK